MEVSKELYEVMRRQKTVLHDMVSLEFSHDFAAAVRSFPEGMESVIEFSGVDGEARYEVIIRPDGFVFGIVGEELGCRTKSIDDVRKFLAYTDGLNRDEMLGLLNGYERGERFGRAAD